MTYSIQLQLLLVALPPFYCHFVRNYGDFVDDILPPVTELKNTSHCGLIITLHFVRYCQRYSSG